MKKSQTRDNRGVTLVELIVAVAILAVLFTVVLSFMTSGTGAYRSIFGNVSLQTRVQTTMNQLQEYLIDCNGGVCYDSSAKTLYILDVAENDDGAGHTTKTVTEHAFALGSDNQLSYSSATVALTGEVINRTAVTGSEPLASRVSDFTAAADAKPSGTAGTSWPTEQITVTVVMEQLGRSATGRQVVALRNRPLTAASEAALLAAILAG